jgi:hypothetical protein
MYHFTIFPVFCLGIIISVGQPVIVKYRNRLIAITGVLLLKRYCVISILLFLSALYCSIAYQCGTS